MMKQNFLSAKLWSRFFLSRTFKSKPVRVRFAPSPTGHLHLGGLRTALYNYLFALSKNGQMILRIEDTDQTRKVEGAFESLVENLEWAGIHCHEGPTQGGSYGPYIQSERCPIYHEHVQNLIAKGSAYRCFCTDRRLDLLRREALRSRQVPKYDNRCRHLTPEQVKEKIDKGEQACVRFKLLPDCKVFEDLVYGSIAYDVSLTEGDPVILKSDGFPTYHLANVVDDHLMEISHVLRGVEWQISTTKHILMYQAFGWTPPQFAHLPLIMNADGSKLSKRQGDIRVSEYRKNGILPMALVNYVTLAGGGFDRQQGEGISVDSIEELSAQFQLERVNSHSSRLNPELLTECNRLELKQQISDSSRVDVLVNDVGLLIGERFQQKQLNLSRQHIKEALIWSAGRIHSLQDLVSPSLAFLWVLPSQELDLNSSDINLLSSLSGMLQNQTNFDREPIKESLKQFSVNNDIKFNKLMKLVRSVLSGLDEGPGVAEMMVVLGKDSTIDRINNVTKNLIESVS